MTATSSQHPDVLTPEMDRVFHENLKNPASRIPMLYTMQGRGIRGDRYQVSSVGTMSDWDEFSGAGDFYDDLFQGFDVTATFLHFVKGFQTEVTLMEDDLKDIFQTQPKAMASSLVRTREKHGARMFNNGFSNDSFFYNHSENVSLFNNSHLTTSGDSTATGFDNYQTAELSHVSVVAARLLAKQFRGDRAEIVQNEIDTILYPEDKFDVAEEISKSMGRPNDSQNAVNVNEGLKLISWRYLTDANNWFALDSQAMAENLFWIDRIPAQFAMVEDFDGIIGKWRGRTRYAPFYKDFRFGVGSEVS